MPVHDRTLDFLKNVDARLLAKVFSDHMPGLFAFVDAERRIRFINPKHEVVFGQPVAQIVGTDLFEVVLPDQRHKLTVDVNTALDGEAVDFESVFAFREKGENFHLKGVLAPFLDVERRPLGFFILLSDVSDTAHSLSKRMAAGSLLASVVDTSPDPVITIDGTGTILSFSAKAREVFGYDRKDVVGRNISMLMPEPDRSEHHHYVERYLSTGERQIIGKPRIVQALKKSGEQFPVRLVVNRFDDGEPIFIGFLQDASKEVEAERRLAESQAELQQFGRLSMLGEFAGAIAHEVGQPLTAAASRAEAAALTLEMKYPDAFTELGENLEQVTSQIRRASEIVRRMRELISRHRAERSVHKINDIVEETCAMALIDTERNGIRVTKDLMRGSGPVKVDRIQIQQVLTNLLRNAVDAMLETEQRDLVISTSRKDDYLEISVSDTGHGISESEIGNLFRPLFTTKPTGLGIGLSLSKSIVDAHQGELTFAGNNDGGSIFTLRLKAFDGEI